MRHTRILETEKAIAFVKESFEKNLSSRLNLIKVSSPLAVMENTGLNDDLNGVEVPVSFELGWLNGQRAVIVHSLAKWKRMRLKELEMKPGTGIWTDMRALRPGESYSPLHSIYVDQWDWEQSMKPQDRNLAFLKNTVKELYEGLKATEKAICNRYPDIHPILPESIYFIHAEMLLRRYPELTPRQREANITRIHGAVFIIGIGSKLSNGEMHDGRAPDYDDWSSANDDGFFGLNGDIVFWNPILGDAIEISSMGIRVDAKTLRKQLLINKCKEKAELPFHQMLLNDELPQSIGGGIGQSRVCMFMLRKKHIGEVQVSIWPENEKALLREQGIFLL